MRSSSRTWLPPVLGLAVFLAVLAAAGVAAADWVKRGTEMRALVTQIEASEAAMTRTQEAVGRAIEAYRAGGETDQATLDAALRAAADEGLAGVQAGADRVAAVNVLPWHRGIARAKDAYLAHNEAWQAYLAAASADPTEFGVPHPDIASTWESAEPLVRRALPLPDVFDLRERIDAVFAEPQGAGPPGADEAAYLIDSSIT